MTFHPTYHTTAATPVFQRFAEFSIWWLSQIRVDTQQLSLQSWCGNLVCWCFRQCFIGPVDLHCQARYERGRGSSVQPTNWDSARPPPGSKRSRGHAPRSRIVESLLPPKRQLCMKMQLPGLLSLSVFAQRHVSRCQSKLVRTRGPCQLTSLSSNFKKENESSVMLAQTQFAATLQFLSSTGFGCLHEKDSRQS